MKKILTVTALLCLCSCARFHTTQTDVSYEKGQPQRQITTKASSTTFFAANSKLAQWKASQTDKTQSANVGNLSQEANASTNLNSIVEAVIGAAIKAAVKP